jgi:hypothetical protein
LNLQQSCCYKLIFLCKSAWIFPYVNSLETFPCYVLYAAVAWSNLSCKSPTQSRGMFTPEQSCLETAYIKNLPHTLCWVCKCLISGSYAR